MRTGTGTDATRNHGEVFDTPPPTGQIVIHPSDVELTAALAEIGATTRDLVVANTREQVAQLNAAIRDHRPSPPDRSSQAGSVATARGQLISVGDRVATRPNDPDLGVANRQTWTVTALRDHGSLRIKPGISAAGRERRLPAGYPRARGAGLRHHRARRPRRDRRPCLFYRHGDH